MTTPSRPRPVEPFNPKGLEHRANTLTNPVAIAVFSAALVLVGVWSGFDSVLGRYPTVADRIKMAILAVIMVGIGAFGVYYAILRHRWRRDLAAWEAEQRSHGR